VKLSPPKLPYFSNLTGTWIKSEEATSPEYWVQHVRQPVKFAAAISELLGNQPQLAFVEVGPGKALSTLTMQQAGRNQNVRVIGSLPAATQEGSDSLASMLRALGQLWGAGVSPDWASFYAREKRRRVPATTYPFEREKYGSLEATQVSAAAPAPAKKPQPE